MAKYWVGGTGNTSDDTNHWALTSGGSPGAGNAPTAADDIFFDGNSGAGTVTINAALLGRSLQTSGSTITTCIHNTATLVTLGDATAGASNIALDLSGFTSYTVGSASAAFSFISTSATQQTITTAGLVLGNVTFGAPTAGTWILADNLTMTTGLLTVSRGIFDSNSKTITASAFNSSNANTRTLTFGSSSMTFTASTATWTCSLTTALTVTANTATVTVPSSGTAFASGTVNWNGLNVVLTGAGTATIAVVGAFTLGSLTRTGTAVTSETVLIGGSFTVGTLSLAGNSAINRLLFQSATLGTPFTVTAATVSLSNVDFMDITGAGAASPFTGTSLGNALGNSGITFTTAATQTWSGTSGGNWSTNTWSGRVPLPQDNVVISSAFISAQTISTDMPRLGADISWAGTTWAGTAPKMSGANGVTSCWYGSLTLVSGMTTASVTGNIWQARGRGTHNLNFNSVSVAPGLTVFAPGGTYNLQSNYSQSNSSGIVMGTYNTNNFNVTVVSTWNVSATGLGATCNFGTSTFSFTTLNAATIFVATPTAIISAASATFILSVTSVNTRTFAGGNNTFGTLTYTVAGSTGPLIISGNNTFGTINFSDATNARTLQFTSFTTNKITTRNIVGTSGKLMTLSAVTPGSPATLISTNPWFMGANSVNVSGNSGLTFTAGSTMNFLSVQDIIGASPPSSNSFLPFFS